MGIAPIDRNPMELVSVKGSSKRAKQPIVLTVEEYLELISLLPDPYRTMVIAVICTGCRVSEILALRWSRIDFKKLTMVVGVKAVNGRVGRVKTEYSEDELPLDPDFAAVLKSWKERCPESLEIGSFRAHLPAAVTTQAQFSRTISVPLGRSLGSIQWAGTRSATRTARGWTLPAHRLACSRSCFAMLTSARPWGTVMR